MFFLQLGENPTLLSGDLQAGLTQTRPEGSTTALGGRRDQTPDHPS